MLTETASIYILPKGVCKDSAFTSPYNLAVILPPFDKGLTLKHIIDVNAGPLQSDTHSATDDRFALRHATDVNACPEHIRDICVAGIYASPRYEQLAGLHTQRM